jgi:hypothetical protein
MQKYRFRDTLKRVASLDLDAIHKRHPSFSFCRRLSMRWIGPGEMFNLQPRGAIEAQETIRVKAQGHVVLEFFFVR